MTMHGKTGLIMGLVNRYSIAFGIASTLNSAGARLLFSAQNERLKQKIQDLDQFSKNEIFTCDVSQKDDIKNLFQNIKASVGKIDFLVHSIAFSDKNELQGKYCDTSRENFLNAVNISCFSLTETCKYASELMPDGGSIVTMTYYGSEKVVPNYNVMGVIKSALESSVRYLASDLGPQGIRVNAISAGPIKTMASSGIHEFSKILDYEKNRSPLKRNVTQDDVGNAALFLLSSQSSGITGETIHVDCGCSQIGIHF